MTHEMKEQVAFVAASMIALADRSAMELRELTQIVGVGAIWELLSMDSLRFELNCEEMAEEICAYTGWEPTLYAPYYDAAYLDKIGRQIADHINRLHPPEGTKVYLLFSLLSSDEMAQKVM